MRKKTIKFSIYLLIFSFIAKILSFFSRIYLARNIDALAMSYYTIVSPTLVILISFVQMGVPNALSKLVADKKYEYKIISSSMYFTIITTSVTTFFYFISIPILSNILFQESLPYLFYSLLPFLPLVALSGLLKGFLMGKQKHMSAAFSQVLEEVSRIIFLIIVFTFFKPSDSINLARIALLSISIGEIGSISYMLFCIYYYKHKVFKKMEYSKASLKDVLALALPMSSGKFIGSFTYFLEPIVMNLFITTIQSKYILLSYGLLNGYVLPLLTMPSFITITLSNYLLPTFSYQYSRNNKQEAMQLFKRIVWFCFFVGFMYSLCLFFFSNEITLLFYNSSSSSEYLKLCALPFIIYAIQPVLSNMLYALDMAKQSAFDTLIGSIVRIGIVCFLTPITLKYSLILGLTIGMMVTTLMHLYRICKYHYFSR